MKKKHKFADYKHCLKAAKFEYEIKHQKKIKLTQIVSEKNIKFIKYINIKISTKIQKP